MSSILKDFNSPMIQQGMQATLSVFKNGGDVNDGSRESDMQEINSIIEDYRDCMKRKAICDATDKNAQSCVYKQKATDCKRKASKLIAKYREKYGRTESSSMMMFAKGGNVQKQEDIVDEAKEKLNASFALPIEIAVYVPSTKGADEKISKAEFIERIEETERYLSSKFGGYSKVDIDGGYVSDEKGLIKEDVAKVVAFSQDEKFLSNLLPQLIKRITLWCDDWTQESIGFEIEGDLFYIDKNFQYDKQMFFDGGQTGTLYNVVDEDGDFLLMGADEKRLIEYANTIFYYDMKDSGESEIDNLEDAIEAFESMNYIVKESKSNRMPSKFNDGGSIAEGNYKMVLSQAKEIHHHIVELQNVLKKEKEIEAWVVGKIETVSADLSTITHYLEGKSEYAKGGEVAVYNDRIVYQYDATNKRRVEQPFTIKKGQLIKYTHSPSARVEAKFLQKLGNKAKIEILSAYKPFTKRVDDTSYVNVWNRTIPSNYLNEVERGTIKTVSVDKIEIVDEEYWRTWRKPISQYLKSPEFKEAFSYLDDKKYADGGEFGEGGNITHDYKESDYNKPIKGTYYSVVTFVDEDENDIDNDETETIAFDNLKEALTLDEERDEALKVMYPIRYVTEFETNEPPFAYEIGIIVDGKKTPQWRKGKNLIKFKDGGSVGKNLKRVVRKGTKYGKLAVKKAKPKAKKIVRKLKIGFNALANKVAKSYEGKAVAPKYQKEYGKRYSKEEAKEVGNKVAAKVKRMKGM